VELLGTRSDDFVFYGDVLVMMMMMIDFMMHRNEPYILFKRPMYGLLRF